jgi:predicted  nucleic acid-binding Zn ribbon protein
MDKVRKPSISVYKENVSTEIEDQGSLYPVLKSSNTEHSFFAGSHCSVCVKKSRIESVCDATNSDSSTSNLQSNFQDVQKEGKATSTQKKKSASARNYTDSYLKFVFIQCPDTDQLPRH